MPLIQFKCLSKPIIHRTLQQSLVYSDSLVHLMIPIQLVDNPQALPSSQICFSSQEETMATPDSHHRKFFRRPAAAPLNPCQASGLPTPHSSLPETGRRSPPVEAVMVVTAAPASSWTRAPASGRRTRWGRCCKGDPTTLQSRSTRPSSLLED